MSRSGTRRASAWLFLSAILASPYANAEEPSEIEARARDAYERGSIAYRHGDYERAAAEFATADALVPNAVTLRTALEAATLADDPIAGTELLLRADRDPRDPELAIAVAAARSRFVHRTGRVTVECPPGPRCLAAIDGTPVEPWVPRVVTVGVHRVTVEASGPVDERMVEVLPDQTVQVSIEPVRATRPMPASAPGKAPTGTSPLWFFTALAVTGVASGFTVWSGIDTLERHASFDDAGCAGANGATCSTLSKDGTSAQTRTNVLLATTAAVAVGTAALGIFVVRWRKSSARDVALIASGSGAFLSLAY